MVAIVVAHGSNRAIGRDGRLPWHLPADLRRFRELTHGHAVVMGRRTFESLSDAFRPLPGRRNLVLSGDPRYPADGAEVFTSLEAALAAAGGDCFVIGGEAVYRLALPHAARVYATEVESAPEADAFFPPLAPAEWRCSERGEPVAENDHVHALAIYDRAA
jgi:dihydrofolate reductase